METLVKELLPVATKIAREFVNIPGLPHAEIEIVAQEAMDLAARLFDPAKCDFSAYAAKSGCGVSPQTVLEATRRQFSSPLVDDFPSHP